MKILLYIILFFISLYWLLPSLWYRVLSPSTIRSVPGKNVSITFDDGPSSSATYLVLETLKKFHLSATFFVLGGFAKDHPEIIEAQIDGEHHVGLHGMNHRCHWFMDPIATFKDIRESKTTVESLGGKPLLFRPPWGLYNLFTVAACRHYGLHWVHWSLHTSDWNGKTTQEHRINTIARKVAAGDIILLHDGRGDLGAARKTALALPDILQVLADKSLSCTSLIRS